MKPVKYELLIMGITSKQNKISNNVLMIANNKLRSIENIELRIAVKFIINRETN
jgi:hypothetical protein